MDIAETVILNYNIVGNTMTVPWREKIERHPVADTLVAHQQVIRTTFEREFF